MKKGTFMKSEEKNRTILIHSRKRAAAAIVVTAAMLMLTIITGIHSGFDAVSAAAAVILSLGAGIWILLDIRAGKIASVFLYLILPFISLWALENYSHVLTDLTIPILVLNLIFFYLIYGLGALLFGSVRVGFSAATLIPMLFGLANYFVVAFRGTPIVPWDLLSLGTAVSVADNYEFTLSWKACFSLMAFLWMILISSKSTVRFRRKPVRFIGAFAAALLLCIYTGEIQKSSVQSFFGMDTTLFTLNVLYRNNGVAAAFLGNLRFLNIEQPEGYSAKKVAALEEEIENSENLSDETKADGTDADMTETGAAAAETTAADSEQYPNVVVIMDEAFSDLSVWGDFETSEEVMPFFKSLQKEAVGGEVYVSVKGGNTANTEFEFLTGDTMGFLPTGSVPYQQYINSETPSLASRLKNLGYSTLAIHPYNRSGWDRDTVYEQFGFDEFLDKDSFDNPYRLRGYISDKSAFEKIIEQFSIKADGEKQFIFEVTMQNHGGYSKESPGFDIYLTLPEVTSKTTSVTATEKYLTLINQTDRALEELITYFEQQEEPVIVLLFGDHQPSDYITNTVQRICGVSSGDSLEDLEQGYRVPFVMWSNYGLEHQYYDGISVNYLSTILMENAGIPLTGYQTFLKQLMQEYPIVNGLVYQDAEGTFHSYEEDSDEESLNDYQMLQYSHLVDSKHRNDAFFESEP